MITDSYLNYSIIKCNFTCIYNENYHEYKGCPICKIPVKDGDLCRLPLCRHIFHETCIFLKESFKCPICQADQDKSKQMDKCTKMINKLKHDGF
jgi:hypothetical protein